jgi:predicted phosphodiesterase
MKIGVLSDTHNHLRETRRALDLLVQHGATHLVHCGDAGQDVVDCSPPSARNSASAPMSPSATATTH